MKTNMFAIVGLAAIASMIGFSGTASAQHHHYHGGRTVVGVGVGTGYYAPPVIVRPAPVYYAPAPVLVRPAPVYYGSPVLVPSYGSPVFAPGFGSPVFAPGFGSPVFRPPYVPSSSLSFGYSSFGRSSAFGIGFTIR